MVRNLKFFEPPVVTETYLRARGFDRDGRKSGGIVNPTEVELPARTVLFRLYHDPKRQFGEWWFTPFEMKEVVTHFARSGPVFSIGRSSGKGILHAVFAVRHDWSKNDPLHLGRFVIIRLTEPLKAYYGQGDHAPKPSQRSVQKAFRIMDAKGVQRFVSQIFLPKLWEYQVAFTDLGHHSTDTHLLGAIEKYRRNPLYFEH